MLTFNTQVPATFPLAPVDLGELDPEQLTRQLVASGHSVLTLAWDEIEPIVLPTEDDAAFLCDAYAELISFVEHGGTHHVFLGDGELDVRATREGGRVHIIRTYSPHLNRHLSTTKEYSVSLESYTQAWVRLIKELLELSCPQNE